MLILPIYFLILLIQCILNFLKALRMSDELFLHSPISQGDLKYFIVFELSKNTRLGDTVLATSWELPHTRPECFHREVSFQYPPPALLLVRFDADHYVLFMMRLVYTFSRRRELPVKAFPKSPDRRARST